MSAVARVRLTTAVAVAVAVVLAAGSGWGRPAWWALPALVAATAAAELAVVHVTFRRQRWTFSLTEVGIAAALLLAPGAWSVPAVAAGVLLAQLLRRQPALKLAFNVALFAVAAAAAVAVDAALGGTIPAACAGLAALWLVATLLVAAPIAVMTGQRWWRVVARSLSLSTLQEAGTSSIGLLGAWLAGHAPFGLLGLVVPVVLLFVSYDEAAARSAEVRLFAALAEGRGRVGEQSLDVSAEVVLTAAARLFGGADVELVLVGPDGPARYSGDESGVSRRRVEPDAFDTPEVLAALGAGVHVGSRDGRPYCAAVLGERAGSPPMAVLVARRPAGAGGFGRREGARARRLVGPAAAGLSMAELAGQRDAARDVAAAAAESARALGDVGADTAPALGALRDTAGRLSRLAAAAGGPADVAAILEELHAVERAVASLLGAVALAADPDLATAVRSAPVEVERESWTTTGLLRRAGAGPR